MELKFTATINISQAEIKALIEAEVQRRHGGVRVVSTTFNVQPPGSSLGIQIGNVYPERVNGTLTGAEILVEKVLPG